MDLARRFSPVLVAVFAFIAAVALIVAPASPASAHDALATSDPAADSVLEAAPEAITLTFTGELLGDGGANAVTVTAPSGQQVQSGAPLVEGTVITQPIAPDAGNGAFTVTWRVVSSDGHPISGEFGYLVEAPAVEPSVAPEEQVTATPSDAIVDEASATPSEEPEAGEQEGGFRLGIFGILAVIVLVAAIVAFVGALLRRRARRGEQD